jgi:hypothetical protein
MAHAILYGCFVSQKNAFLLTRRSCKRQAEHHTTRLERVLHSWRPVERRATLPLRTPNSDVLNRIFKFPQVYRKWRLPPFAQVWYIRTTPLAKWFVFNCRWQSVPKQIAQSRRQDCLRLGRLAVRSLVDRFILRNLRTVVAVVFCPYQDGPRRCDCSRLAVASARSPHASDSAAPLWRSGYIPIFPHQYCHCLDREPVLP